MKDVLDRLPTQPARLIGELLPHCWKQVTALSSRLLPSRESWTLLTNLTQ